MTHRRRALAPVIAFWLFGQIATVAAVPVALWVSGADRHAEQCTCGHGNDALCPMHHKPSGKSAPCAMQATDHSGTAVLTAAIGAAGLMVEPARDIGPATSVTRVHNAGVPMVGERPGPPDPPPPRT